MISENINILSFSDIIFIPLYLLIIYLLIKKTLDKNDLPLFIKGWKIKILFTLVNLCIFQFYYGGKTDGTTYQYAVDVLRYKAFDNSFSNVLEFVFTSPQNYSQETIRMFSEISGALATNKLISIGYIISCIIICKNYAILSLFFSLIAYIGAWLMYKVFIDVYPKYKAQLGYTILFAPSVCFWASCFMKDSLTFAGLGFVFYAMYFLLIKLKFQLSTLLLFIIGIYFLTIKIYILACIAPLFGLWLFMVYKNKIRTPFLKVISLASIAVIGYFGISLILNKIGSFDSRYDIENLTATMEGMSEYLSRADASESSTYDIGLTNLTSPSAIVAVFPKAVNVALFRPYLWESRKPIYIPAALEAFASMLFIIFIFLRIGFIFVFKVLYKNPLLLISIIFTIIFSFMTGATSGNFGTLVRYKIPCLPFLYSTLLIIYLDYKNSRIHAKTNTINQ